jgi:lysophospholipase L1-like esterase
MSTISILDARIRKLGRWNAQGDGVWSGWGGSQLKFKVSGTNSLTVNASVTRPAGTVAYCECVIDNSPENSILKSFVNGQVTFDIPDTNEHSIVIKTNGYRVDIFNQVSKSVLLTLKIDDAGSILAQDCAPLLLQCVGDSWMAADNDWPRLIRPDMFDTHQVATGGMTCANSNSDYIYNANGILADDPQADAVIVSFGVNDFNSGVSVTTFQSNLSSLITKIRTFQSCPIFLIQVPRNINTGDKFDQYGAAMRALVANDVYYMATSHLPVTWQSDERHLDARGKTILSDHVASQLLKLIGVSSSGSLNVNYFKCYGENILTKEHALRHSTMLGFKLKHAGSNSFFKIKVGDETLTVNEQWV